MFIEITDGTGRPMGVLPMTMIGAIAPPSNGSGKGVVRTLQGEICYTSVDYSELVPIVFLRLH